ncbi:Pancreatic lipase-related protein 2 [Halotydeus destructor]|nr:Pancreatic lipase-related protein 2 [Halotydeus destructor]
MSVIAFPTIIIFVILSVADGQAVNDTSPTYYFIPDSVSEVVACLTGTGFTDKSIGTFDLSDSSYCNCSCGRCIPGLSCCVPQTPEAFGLRLRLFVSGKPERDLDWNNATEKEVLTGQVVFHAHGLIETPSSSLYILPIVQAWVARGRQVILVDWRHGNQLDYFQAIANVRVVGAVIGFAILNWNLADRTLVSGMSLGGQIIGEAGRYTQQHGGVKIKECHGLDPAGPFFDGCSSIQLSKSDCELVKVIHTNAGSLGTSVKSGHCDYWVNCGHDQGSCLGFIVSELVHDLVSFPNVFADIQIQNTIQAPVCSHWRAEQLYLNQLTGKCNFNAEVCTDCGSNTDCHGNGSTTNHLPPDGQCDPSMDIDYYVHTSLTEPYC